MWFRKNSSSGALLEGFENSSQEEYRDSAGFELGLVLKGDHHATVVVNWNVHHSVESLRSWERFVASTDNVVAAATVVGGTQTWGCVTFHAEGRKNRRQRAEFLSDLAASFSEMHGPDGVISQPASTAEVNQRFEKLCGSQITSWPYISAKIDERESSFRVGDQFATVFEVTVDTPEVEEELAELVLRDEFKHHVRFTRVFRPSQDIPGGGRNSGLFVVYAQTEEPKLQALIAVVVSQMSPWLRLRIRRMWCRQQLGFSAALGLGVWPWQSLQALK